MLSTRFCRASSAALPEPPPPPPPLPLFPPPPDPPPMSSHPWYLPGFLDGLEIVLLDLLIAILTAEPILEHGEPELGGGEAGNRGNYRGEPELSNRDRELGADPLTANYADQINPILAKTCFALRPIYREQSAAWSGAPLPPLRNISMPCFCFFSSHRRLESP